MESKARVFIIEMFPYIGGGGLTHLAPIKIIMGGLAPLAPDKLHPCPSARPYIKYKKKLHFKLVSPINIFQLRLKSPKLIKKM